MNILIEFKNGRNLILGEVVGIAYNKNLQGDICFRHKTEQWDNEEKIGNRYSATKFSVYFLKDIDQFSSK